MGKASAGRSRKKIVTVEAMVEGLRELRSMQLGMDDLDVREHHQLLDSVIRHLKSTTSKEAPRAAHSSVLPAHTRDRRDPDLCFGLAYGAEEPPLTAKIQAVRDIFAAKGELCATVHFLDALDKLLLEAK